ncbi:MAG TPA: hypothetical protein VJN64_02845 [Terriglobales bacterium]|nr:hypothetical protein [Terriglobales bacterium]
MNPRSHRGLWLAVLIAASAGSVWAQPQVQSPMLPAAFDLVQQILATAGTPGSMSVSFRNISVLPPNLQETVQTAIFTSFRNSGVRLVPQDAALAQAEITFSENLEGYLWIARVQQGTTSKLLMKEVPRLEGPSATKAQALTLHKTTVWIQDSPILDFYRDQQMLIVLEPSQISTYVSQNGQWRPRYTLAITHSQPWPRDLRGRLQVNGAQMTAFLPGTRCTGTLSSPSLECRDSDDPWQLDQGTIVAFFSARRNFFTGLLSAPSAGASVLPFFSAAALQAGDTHQWLFAGTDGRTRLYQDELSAPAAVFSAWGSNIAAIHSGCGSGWQLLAGSPSDSVRPDSVQAVEISGREAQPASSSVELAGSLESLSTAGKNGEFVNGVLHSTATGKYEAFTLTVGCGQ